MYVDPEMRGRTSEDPVPPEEEERSVAKQTASTTFSLQYWRRGIRKFALI
jgi:hypothetical protein